MKKPILFALDSAILILIIGFVLVSTAFAQVGVNTLVPNASSMLDIVSTNRGMLIPRMTTAQKNAIPAPATGLLVYDDTMDQFFYFDGLVWRPLSSNNTAWNLTGNTATVAGTNFIGTIDSVDFIVKTRNIERMRVKGKGNVSIGAGVNPAALLDVYISTTADTLVYRGRNSSSSGTTHQIGSIEVFRDFSNTIDFNNNANSAQFSINLDNNATHDLQLGFDDAAKPGTNTWTISSDARLKEDVSPFRDGLEIIKQINPVYYRYNGKAGMPTADYYVGVLAQDLQQVTPYMVGSFEYTPNAKNIADREEYLSVNNGALTYVLLNSVKELDVKTEKLSAAIKTVTDFGMSEVAGNEARVFFSQEFSTAILSGRMPVVTATAINSSLQVSVKDISMDGFTIVADGNTQIISVNWIAAAKIREGTLDIQKDYTPGERQQLIDKVKMRKSVIRTGEEDAEAQRRMSGN